MPGRPNTAVSIDTAEVQSRSPPRNRSPIPSEVSVTSSGIRPRQRPSFDASLLQARQLLFSPAARGGSGAVLFSPSARGSLIMSPGAQRIGSMLSEQRQRGESTTQESLLEPMWGSECDEVGSLDDKMTIFNLANIVMGVGVLSVPYALKQSGYFALVLVVIVIGVTTKTAKWIGLALEMAGRRKEAEGLPHAAWDFSFLAKVAFGDRAASLINGITIVEVWLALVTFMVMNGGNAAVLFPEASTFLTVPVAGVIGTLCCFIPSDKFAYMSLLATLCMMLAAATMVGSTFMLPKWFNPYDHLGSPALLQLENIPRSIGIIVFCFAGHPCFCQVKTEMVDPARWGHCVDVSFLVAFLYYAAFGFLGYIVFGSSVSPMLTENLQGIPGALICRNIAAGCFLVKIQLTVPLLMNAVLVGLWKPSPEEPLWSPGRCVVLAAVSSLTIVTALALSNAVAAVASLTGSLFVMATSVLFPALVHLRLKQQDKARRFSTFQYLEYGFILIFGCVQAVWGTILACQDFANGTPGAA